MNTGNHLDWEPPYLLRTYFFTQLVAVAVAFAVGSQGLLVNCAWDGVMVTVLIVGWLIVGCGYVCFVLLIVSNCCTLLLVVA